MIEFGLQPFVEFACQPHRPKKYARYPVQSARAAHPLRCAPPVQSPEGRIMAAPTNIIEFIDLVAKSNVLEKRTLDSYLQKVASEPEQPATTKDLAQAMVRDGLLTHLQA